MVVPPEDVERALATLGEGAQLVDAAAGRLSTPRSPEETAKVLVAAGVVLRELRPTERSLEDVFAWVTR